MSAIRPLDPRRHAAMAFDRNAVAATRGHVQIGASEIALAAADMPLCLAKDGRTGGFNLIALLGLVEPGNLFAQDGRLHATYVPRAAALSCFRLDADGAAGLAVDEDDAALGRTGQRLFADGGATPFLTDVAGELAQIVADVGAAQRLVDGYVARHLVRPLRLVFTEDGGRERAIEGLYTLDPDAIRDLPDDDVLALHRSDALTTAGVLTASLAQIERLRQLHNARHPVALARVDIAL